jgi:rare lipoprotein A
MERWGPGRAASTLVLVLVVAAACARVAAPPPPLAPGFEERGQASWYGEPHHGRPTASGEIFDMHALTAAHRALPFGTRVLVTRLDTGRSVEVRINDRGPFVDGRIVDLSYAAARALGAVGPGVVPVRLRVVALPVAPAGAR